MMNLAIEWYYVVWPWIGLGAAIILLILLFGTSSLRNELSMSRWKDRSWLSWLAATAYLIHNVEEYGIDLYGNIHAFPETMKEMIHVTPPESFFASVNISMFWFGLPIAAALSKKHPILATGGSGVLLINAFSHIAPLICGAGYTPGTLTAVVLFLPISFYTFFTCFGKDKLSFLSLAFVIFMGIFTHLMLLVSIMLYTNNSIGSGLMVVMQMINALLALLLWLGFEKLFKNKLYSKK